MSSAVEWAAKYTLTGPDGTKAVFNDSADPDFVGMLSAESSGLDSPEVRESAQDATEADGGIHGDFFYGRRPVILQGTILATSKEDRNAKVAKLKRASNAMRGDATLTWKPAGATEELELKLRRQQPLRITEGFVKKFMLPMVSADAYILSAAEKSAEAKLLTTSVVFPTEAVSAAGIGTVAWTNPANALTSNDVRATAVLPASAASNWLKTTKYGLALPSNAFPVRARVKVEGQGSVSGLKINEARTVKAGVIAADAATSVATFPAGSDATREVDIPLSAYSKADIENTGFGAAASLVNSAGEASTASIDAVSMYIQYGTPLEVTNAGNAPTDFIATFTGDLTGGNVELINETTGEALIIAESLEGGKTITIDTKNRTIVHSTKGNIYSSLDFVNSTWFKLAPGVNKLKSTRHAVVVNYRNAYL